MNNIQTITQDNVQALLWSRTLQLGDTLYLRIIVGATKSDASAHAGFSRECWVYNTGTGLSFGRGKLTVALPDDNTPAWDVTIQGSGNDVQLLVTGAAATTILWRAWIEALIV